MNITFLIGNGFDCALGLETRYSQFYEWYSKQPKDSLSNHVKEFRAEIDKYIKKSADAQPYWADAELGLGSYTEKFSLDTVYDFLDCYDDFHSKLTEYISLQNRKVNTKWAEEAKSVFVSQLLNYDKLVDPKEQQIFTGLKNKTSSSYADFNFITFNYTKAFDAIYGLFGSSGIGSYKKSSGYSLQYRRGKLVHIHGYADKYPILGVCSNYSIKNQELLKDELFATAMLKSKSLDTSGQLWKTEAFKLIDNSDIICIFGMSLGESDSDYWEKILDWLEISSDKQLVVFWRCSKAINIETSVLSKARKVKEVQEILLDYSAWSEDKFEKIKNRIHIVINSNEMFCLPDNLRFSNNTLNDIASCI